MQATSRDLQVEMIPVTEVSAYAGNARTHSSGQIEKIAESIRTFGWTVPVLVDANLTLVAGHARFEAALLLAIKSIPAIRIADLSDAQIRAYRLADNKLAEGAAWDDELLKIELTELIECDSEIELTSTGFEMAEIDLIIGEPDARLAQDEFPAQSDLPVNQVSKVGSLWLLGDRHRLLCGNALCKEDLDRLMDGASAELGLSDPPYNVAVKSISGRGRRKHREFAMASGEMSADEFTGFLTKAFENMAACSRAGSVQFIFMDWRHLCEAQAAGHAVFGDLINMCVWDKGAAGMGGLYRSAYELVLVFRSGRGQVINNVQLGKFGRNRSNIWRYKGLNGFGPDRDTLLDQHPTAKPVSLLADAILDCSNRNGLVLDPFCGSGSILVACERTGRRARALELDPHYVDGALRRFQRITGIEPVCAESGITFGELERQAGQKENDTQ